MDDTPFVLTAVLQQGIVLDARYRLTLDGLLVSVMREMGAQGLPGSLYDGGLDSEEPVDYDLPLKLCREVEGLHHWMVTGADPINPDGSPITVITPDVHRLSVRWDDKRGGKVGVKVSKDAGGPRGRFRPRVTPVLTVPAYGVVWRGVGDPDRVLEIVKDIPSIGGRRGAGEGRVLRWEIAGQTGDSDLYGHVMADRRLGRPVPIECAERVGATYWKPGSAGIRPPLFHVKRQHILAVPWNSTEDIGQ